MLYQSTNYQAILEQLEIAAEKILTEIQNLKYSDMDARHVGLTNMRIAILKTAYQVSLLKNLKSGLFPWPTIAPYMGIVSQRPLSEDSFTIVGDIIDSCERMGLQTIYQFQLENMLANILSALGLPQLPTYRQIVRCLLSHLKIAEPDKKEASLVVLALIRNMLHNNGVHKKADYSLMLGSVAYEFKRDTAIRCGDWDYLVYALQHSIDAVLEIIGHPTVRSLQQPIFDNFAWDIESM